MSGSALHIEVMQERASVDAMTHTTGNTDAVHTHLHHMGKELQ